MTDDLLAADVTLLDLLRKRGSMSVSELASLMQVTATAVRQRLTRLSGQGLIERSAVRSGRGRPSHEYRLTAKGRRKTGTNFADLALALWEEIRAIRDPEVRRGLLQRLAHRLAGFYGHEVRGSDIGQRMDSLVELYAERKIPLSVDRSGELPVLQADACPFPDLAERDRTICAVERMMFSEVLGGDIRLSRCRLDGDTCCTFEPSGAGEATHATPGRPSHGPLPPGDSSS